MNFSKESSKTSNIEEVLSEAELPGSRRSKLSFRSHLQYLDGLPTDTPGTRLDSGLQNKGNSNLKFRISPKSCIIVGSQNQKEPHHFDLRDMGSPTEHKREEFYREMELSPKLMVVDSLKNRLLKCHKNLVSKAKAQDRWAEEKQEEVDCVAELDQLSNTDFAQLDVDQSIDLITKDKKVSLAFQQFAWTCWLGQFPELSESIIKGIERLILHPLGNYILQKILIRDLKIRRAAEELCKEKFANLCKDQFASRVIQKLIELSPEFREFATGFFRQFAWDFIDSMPAVYLLVSVIKCAENDAEIGFVEDLIRHHLSFYSSCKYLKRIVVVYLTKIQQDKLPNMFSLFKLRNKTNLFNLFNEKFYSYVFLTFLCREFQSAIDLLALYIKKNLRQLLRTRYFLFVITKVLRLEDILLMKSACGETLVDCLVDSMCKRPASDLKDQRFSYLCYFLLSYPGLLAKEKLASYLGYLEYALDQVIDLSSNYKFNLRKSPTM